MKHIVNQNLMYFFCSPSGSHTISFISLAARKKNTNILWCVFLRAFPPSKLGSKKNNKNTQVGDKIVNPDGHPYEILERLGHGTFGQAGAPSE